MSVSGANWSEISVAPRMVFERIRWIAEDGRQRLLERPRHGGEVDVRRRAADPRDHDDAGKLDLRVDPARQRQRRGDAERHEHGRGEPDDGRVSPETRRRGSLGLVDGRAVFEPEDVLDRDVLEVLHGVVDLEPVVVTPANVDGRTSTLPSLHTATSAPSETAPRRAETGSVRTASRWSTWTTARP